MMWLLVLFGWAWACLGTADSDPIIGKLGGDIVLKPENVPDVITSIRWQYGPNFAVQYDGSVMEYYRHFKERGSLNKSNGELTIIKLALTDSNDYTPEINNKIQSPIKLKVLRSVPKPKIIESDLRLTCDGDTKDAEPVTYSWTVNDVMLSFSSKEISKQENYCSESVTCTMRNPISETTSDALSPCPPPIPQIVSYVAVAVLLLLVGLVVFHKVKSKEWFFQKGLQFWKADFWKDTRQSTKDNGEHASENTPMGEK